MGVEDAIGAVGAMPTEHDLTGKTAVVTGSIRGIGFNVARSLVERGAHVMFSDMPAYDEPLDKNDPESETPQMIIDGLREEFPNVDIGYTKADVTDYQHVENLMAETAKLGVGQNGKNQEEVSILVNNAGIQYKAKLDEFPLDRWNQVINVNLTGVFHCMREAAKYMENAVGGGRIFNIASVNGHLGSPEKAAYCSTKAAVINLMKAAAVDYADKGISCFSISPGFLPTELALKQVDDFMEKDGLSREEATAKLLEFQTVKEFIPFEAVNNVIINLSATDQKTATQLSGRDIRIDNGWRKNVHKQRPPEFSDEMAAKLAESGINVAALQNAGALSAGQGIGL